MRTRVASLLFVGLLLSPAVQAQTPPKPTVAPDQLMKDIHADIAEGKLVNVWKALPSSYQKDVQAVISEAADKIDPEVFDRGVAVFRKAVKLLKDKKDLILKNDAFGRLALTDPKNGRLALTDPKKLPEFYDASLAILEILAASELTRLDDLKKADVEKFLSGTGSNLFKQYSAVEDFFDQNTIEGKWPVHQFRGINERFQKGILTVVKVDDKEATIHHKKTSGFKIERDVVLRNVEGKWVDKQFAEEWPTGAVKGSRTGLALVLPFVSKDGKPAALDFLAKVDKSLDTLAAAKTADDFNKAVANQLAQWMGKP